MAEILAVLDVALTAIREGADVIERIKRLQERVITENREPTAEEIAEVRNSFRSQMDGFRQRLDASRQRGG